MSSADFNWQCSFPSAADQWMQFDVGPPTLVTGLVTKGRGDSTKKHWVTKFRVSYSNDSKTWNFYMENGQTVKVNHPSTTIFYVAINTLGSPESF